MIDDAFKEANRMRCDQKAEHILQAVLKMDDNFKLDEKTLEINDQLRDKLDLKHDSKYFQ